MRSMPIVYALHSNSIFSQNRTFMKNLMLLTLLAFFAVSCGNGPAGEKVEAADAVETNSDAEEASNGLQVDVQNSQIDWTGAKLAGKTHTGTIELQGGTLTVEDGQLSGGEFVINMGSIRNTDMDGDGAQKLAGHLMSADFFDSANFPTATFTIAEVAPATDREDASHMITGNLTMKGVTKSIVIPARIKVGERGLSALTPDFTIDRTAWNVMYGAGALGTLQDQVINDEIGLRINLTAQ